MSLQTDLIAYLIALGTAAQGRVHDEMVPQGVALPFIASTKLSGNQPVLLNGAKLLSRAQIRLAIFATTALQRESIVQAIEPGLNGFRGAIGGTLVSACRVEVSADEVALSDGDKVIKGTGLDLFFTYSTS